MINDFVTILYYQNQDLTLEIPKCRVTYYSNTGRYPISDFSLAPEGEDLRQLKEFKLWHIHSICFDQLLPRIANYYRKDEARKLLVDVGLQNVEIYQCNGNSWTVIGVKR